MKTQAPIGVLDSGLGGLSVLVALRQRMPAEDFVYCADSGNAPWGERSPDFITQRCDRIVNFLLEQDAKAIVLACNTATAIAAEHLRCWCPVPVIGIEPAVKPAVQSSPSGKIGVLATSRTIESPRYASLLERFAQDAHVISQPAPGLMECVEQGRFDAPSTRSLLSRYLTPMLGAGVDTLVLGCTHYPFLSPVIGELTGNKLRILEPGPAVAKVTRDRLSSAGTLRSGSRQGTETFYIKDVQRFSHTLSLLWPEKRPAHELPV